MINTPSESNPRFNVGRLNESEKILRDILLANDITPITALDGIPVKKFKSDVLREFSRQLAVVHALADRVIQYEEMLPHLTQTALDTMFAPLLKVAPHTAEQVRATLNERFTCFFDAYVASTAVHYKVRIDTEFWALINSVYKEKTSCQ